MPLQQIRGFKRINGYLTPRDAAHTCVHSDKQYCLLRKPSLNTMSSFRTEIGPSPGAPAYHNLLWQQHFYTHDNTVYLDCKLLCGRHPLAIAYFKCPSHKSPTNLHDYIHWCLVLTSTHINAYSADPRRQNENWIGAPSPPRMHVATHFLAQSCTSLFFSSLPRLAGFLSPAAIQVGIGTDWVHSSLAVRRLIADVDAHLPMIAEMECCSGCLPNPPIQMLRQGHQQVVPAGVAHHQQWHRR